MKTEIQSIIATLKHTFEKNAWHGPAVMEAVEKITAEQSVTRFPNTHSIIELIAHMTSWRLFVTSRLEGNNDYKVTEEMNFPPEKDWKKAIHDLTESQSRLLAALEKFQENKLHEIVPNASHKYSFYIMLHGIIHHDLYHTGQIVLITKSFSGMRILS